MKISLLIPRPNFLERLKSEFEKLGHEVLFNDCHDSCDVILGMSISQLSNIQRFHNKYPNIPLITYNWDWYDHIDKKTGDWLEFTNLMKESKEVWASSEITALKCFNDTQIESPVWFYAYILPEEWEGANEDKEYIIQASRRDGYKRFDWFEKASQELGIPFKTYHPNINSREDYIDAIKNCSFIVSSSKEDSIGGLTLMEASYCGKPIMVGNHEGAVEVWGGHAWYFNIYDYEDYKSQMKWLWDNRKSSLVHSKTNNAQQLVQSRFVPSIVAEKMIKRLETILEKK